MKISNRSTHLAGLLAASLLAGIAGATRLAADEAPLKPASGQRVFDSPDDAVKALQAAAESKDQGDMKQLFGPEFRELITGDEALDAKHRRAFAAHMAQGVQQVKEGEDKITLEVGTNNWPMPVPLVKAEGKWFFDTPAGKEEVINRHIGKDELHAIGVCRDYVEAQRKFAAMNAGAGGATVFARKFKSEVGKKDGSCHWPVEGSEPASPFGPLVAEAHAEGYHGNKGAELHPFHGYYFRILTRQGKAAPGGKMSYLSGGEMTRGFALVAFPQHWDQSGIMTFLVGQDGKVYQRNFGEKTYLKTRAMEEYNPDKAWTVVEEEGIKNSVTEK